MLVGSTWHVLLTFRQSTTPLLLSPSFELLVEVSFKLSELVSENLPTTPALILCFEIRILIAGLPPRIVRLEWEVLQRDEEVGVEAVVMLLMLQAV